MLKITSPDLPQTCILSFNHPQITAKCVHDTLRFVAEDSLTLTHNGSRPENVAILKKEFPRIEHLELTENTGFSGGANASLKHIFKKSPWVFFVTNDCELLSEPAAPLAAGLYAPLIYRRKIEMIDSIGGLFTPSTARLEHIRETSRAREILASATPPEGADFATPATTQFFYVPGTAFYLDHDTFNKLEGFDETLHTYWEDVDFSVRAYKKNLHLNIAPETRLIHKVGKTCHKDPFYTNFLFQRNKKIISERYV